MDCDSAYFYEARNSLKRLAISRCSRGYLVYIRRLLYYDGNSQIAMLRENVKMQNKGTVLTTDSLNYDRVFNLGYFFRRRTLTDEENILTSDWGEYSPATKNAVFNYDVKLVNPKFTLTSDTLRYNSLTKIATIVGPSEIVNDQNSHLFRVRFLQHHERGSCPSLQRSVLTNGQRKLVGDSIHYDRTTGFGEAFRNVVMTDTENKNMLTGEYGYYDELKGQALVTDSAVAINYSQNNDSLYMHGDTLPADYLQSEHRLCLPEDLCLSQSAYIQRATCKVCAIRWCSIPRTPCMTMYHDPIVWNGTQQLFGEEIRAYMNDSTIEWAHIINQAMSVEQLDLRALQQVSGKEIKAFFKDGDLRQVDVIGNVRLGYFSLRTAKTVR